ncbi:hypothetical protein RMATCC62417_17396 [Rhizopus microsporus]|nr:hypothetical protein RMATCC62417_17396 [Rhizopus microsporus]
MSHQLLSRLSFMAYKENLLSWKTALGEVSLEAKASPYIPLRACVGSWGANMLLDYYWSSIRRRNKKQATSGTGKAKTVQGSSNESRLMISEATSPPVVDEEFTFDFDASIELTVDGPQRYLLGKKLDDKGKSSASRKQRRTVTSEEEGEQYESQ